MNLFKALSLLQNTTEETSFQALVELTGLDPATDLQGCNFSGVDFGIVTFPVLNLSYCDLYGANLQYVRSTIIDDNARKDDNTRLPIVRAKRDRPTLFSELHSFVDNFHIPTFVPEQILDTIFNTRLVAGGYNSPVEHDLTEKETMRKLIEGSRDLTISPYSRGRYMNIIKLSTRALPQNEKIDAKRADAINYSLLSKLSDADAIVIPPDSDGIDNYSLPTSTVHSFLRVTKDFTDIGKLIYAVMFDLRLSDSYTIVLLSGFLPFSNSAWSKIRKDKDFPIRFIVLSPTTVIQGMPKSGNKSSNLAPFHLAFPRDKLTVHDLEDFLRRLKRVGRDEVSFSDDFVHLVMDCADKHLGHLRNFVKGSIDKAQYHTVLGDLGHVFLTADTFDRDDR